MVGEDLVTSSLVKNPGGTIVPSGCYVAGRKTWLTQPQLANLHLASGWTLGQHLAMLCELSQGLVLAPQIVGEAVKLGCLSVLAFSSKGHVSQGL